jgi:hypothetical protein
MKQFSTLLFILIFSASTLNNLYSQAAGDYRSVSGGGNWNEASTWETFNGSTWVSASTEPVTSNDVSILSGHTVNIIANASSQNLTVSGTLIFGKATIAIGQYTLNLVGNLTVSSGASINVYDASNFNEHEIFISGNLQNDGAVTTLSSSNSDALYFNFNGTDNTFVTGNSITFSGLTINLTTGRVIDFQNVISIDDPDENGFRLLDLQSGILKISSASSFEAFSGASSIPSAAGLYLNHASANLTWGSSGSLEVNGLLQIDAGTMNIGSTSGNKIDINGSGAQFAMVGGTLNITGYWDQTSSGDANISGGSVNVLTKSSVTNSIDIVNIPSTSDFIMSGGSLNVKNVNTGTGTVLYINKGGNTSITGGTVSIENADAETGLFDFSIDDDLPLYNFTVNIGSSGILEDVLSNLVISNDLIISSGTLQIDPDLSLTVNGSFSNNSTNPGILLKSDASGTGSLIVHGTVSGSGTVTQERFMDNADWSNWKDGWHFLGSPVTNQAISPAFTTDPASGYDFYLWNEPTNEWVNFKNQSGGGGKAPYFDVLNGSTNFELGRGYMAAYDDGGVKSFTGQLNVGDVEVSGLTYSSGANKSWHLLGNPFSSGLTWDGSAAWDLTNIAGVAKIWNEENQSYTDLSSSPSSEIPATNGFMVQVSTGTGSLTIPAEKKVHTSQDFYKSSSSAFMLTAISQSAGNAQESKIVINPESTSGYDFMFDSEYLTGHAPAFYSLAGGLQLSTNSLPELTADTEIPFVFVKNDGSQFSIEASGIENIQATPYLLDLKTGITQNLTENPIYNFTASNSDDPNRFLLKFTSVGIEDVDNYNKSINIYTYNNNLYLNSDITMDASVEIFNLTGQQVYGEQVLMNGLTQINPNLRTGWYVVKVSTDEGMASDKVFIK